MIQAATTLLERKGKVFLKAIGITEKYLTPVEIDGIKKYGPNQHVIYRHNHPSSEANGEIVGTVLTTDFVDVKDDDGKTYRGVEIEAELLDITSYQKKTIEYCKKSQDNGNPIKISVGTQSFGNKGEPPVDSRPFEFSLTHNPVCKECSGVVKTMENEDKARIAELKASLDKALSINKSTVKKYEAEIEAMKAETESHTNKFEESLTTAVDTVTKKYEEEMAAMGKRLESAETELLEQKKAPIIAKIFELEEDEFARDNWYNTLTLEKLNERLDYVKKNVAVKVTPVIRRFEDTRRDGDAKVAEYKANVIKKLEMADPTLAKILSGGSMTDAERAKYGGRT